MIKTAADKRTAQFLEGRRVPEWQGLEKQLHKRIAVLNEATCIADLAGLPSNRFEALEGNRKGQFSIRVNDRWRICFIFKEGDVEDVEIVDYH